MASIGIPLSKVGAIFVTEGDYEAEWPSTEALIEAINTIKGRGLAGLSLFSINSENNRFRGEFAKMVAELLYF